MSLFLSIRFRGSSRAWTSFRIMSGVSKPLRAYVEPSRGCLIGFSCFVWSLVFERIRFVYELVLIN